RLLRTAAVLLYFFFFTAPAPTEIYPLSLHDALPIWAHRLRADRVGAHIVRARAPGVGTDRVARPRARRARREPGAAARPGVRVRSEEHTSELQSLAYLVCRLLLEKKKQKTKSAEDTS